MSLNSMEHRATLRSAATWTFQGMLCTSRFLWICPYNALNTIKLLKLNSQDTKDFNDLSDNVKETSICDSSGSKVLRKGREPAPGGPDCTTATSLHKRLTETERGILSLKTRIGFERASWQQRFAELKKKQEELRSRLISDNTTRPGVLVKVGRCGDKEEVLVHNDEVFEESSAGCQSRCRVSELMSSRGDAFPSSLTSRQLSLTSVCDSSADSSSTTC